MFITAPDENSVSSCLPVFFTKENFFITRNIPTPISKIINAKIMILIFFKINLRPCFYQIYSKKNRNLFMSGIDIVSYLKKDRVFSGTKKIDIFYGSAVENTSSHFQVSKEIY